MDEEMGEVVINNQKCKSTIFFHTMKRSFLGIFGWVGM